MLEFKKVTKNFGKIKALEDVSFKVGKGELVFIVGPSGSGKTTVLRLLLGEIRPSSGKVVFEGNEVAELKGNKLAAVRQEMGVVFQDFKLLGQRTVAENIEIALAVKGVEKDHWKKRVDQVLDIVDLSDRADLFPSQLSGGEIQRVGLARALVVDPKLVFADEPTGNLDWDTAEAIVKLLVKINENGRTVIISSHHKQLVNKFAKRIIEIESGKIVGDTKKITKAKNKQ